MGLMQSMSSSSSVTQFLASSSLEVTPLRGNPKTVTREHVLNNQTILTGHPSTKTSTQFEGHLSAGTWECEEGSWDHVQSGDEYVQLIEVIAQRELERVRES